VSGSDGRLGRAAGWLGESETAWDGTRPRGTHRDDGTTCVCVRVRVCARACSDALKGYAQGLVQRERERARERERERECSEREREYTGSAQGDLVLDVQSSALNGDAGDKDDVKIR
jgi:hypothetical protein